jgi:hypothetical protein
VQPARYPVPPPPPPARPPPPPAPLPWAGAGSSHTAASSAVITPDVDAVNPMTTAAYALLLDVHTSWLR